MRFLAISGSLKSTSINTLVLRAIASVAPPQVQFVFYNGLANLPHFSPELDTDTPPDAVQHWRAQLRSADAVLICTPEYAYGMPGSLKNALDWTVSSGEFVGKPVAAMSAAPNAAGGARAYQGLVMTLTALSANIVEDASVIVPLVRSKFDDLGRVIEPVFAQELSKAVAALVSVNEEVQVQNNANSG